MAGLFGFHMEDRTSDFPEGVRITEGDEGESVAAAIAEVTEEEAGIEEAERETEQLEDEGDLVSETAEVLEEAPKTEAAGLTGTSARILGRILKHVGGERFRDKKMPKLESFSDGRASRRDSTKIVLENVQDSLKSFWEALKKQFLKVWNNIKTWYAKTFSAAKRLADKAKSVRDRAENMSATIDKRTFAFGQAAKLAIGGKVRDVSPFERALTELSSVVQSVSEVDTSKTIEDLSSKLDNIKDLSSSDPKTESLVGVVQDLTSKVKASESNAGIIEDKVKKAYGSGVKISSTAELPGGKVFVLVEPSSTSDINASLRQTRVDIANTKDKPREIGSDTEITTLNPSQISKFADTIVSSCGDIFDYEKQWQKTDKAQTVILKRIDEVMRDNLQDNDDNENGPSKEREIRTLAQNLTNFVKKMGSVQGKVSSYAIGVYAATINWCEGSMRNYK